MVDRREFERYRIVPSSWLHARGSGFFCLGHIVDISLSGVAYEYIFESMVHPRRAEIDLFSKYNNVLGLPCRLIYDHYTTPIPNSRIITRRCGLAFQDLTAEEERRLWTFISTALLDQTIPQHNTAPIWEVLCRTGVYDPDVTITFTRD